MLHILLLTRCYVTYENVKDLNLVTDLHDTSVKDWAVEHDHPNGTSIHLGGIVNAFFTDNPPSLKIK